MKITTSIKIIFSVLLVVTQLNAAEKWEGSDSFDSVAKWKNFVKQGPNGEYGQIFILGGQAVYSATLPTYDNAACWAWGSTKKWTVIPTGRSWEINQDAIFPETSPSATYSDVGIGFALYAEAGTGSYRAVWARLVASYSSSEIQSVLQAESDFNFEARPSSTGGGPVEESGDVSIGSRRFTLVFRHDALSRIDTFRVKDPNTGNVLYERIDPSTLSQAKDCVVGPWISIDRYATWPAGSTYLAADNWILRSITPDPINLNSKTSTSNGVNYTVAVTALGMTGTKLTGTVALTVGSASASLPITGSIDKNGYFVLTAKGTGSNKGFGCVLLYDVATGTYLTSKNTVTAPKQTAIKF
jgi:hypothetical protein